MSETKISWADDLDAGVVAADELTRPTIIIEARERSAAAASARYIRVSLTWIAEATARRAVALGMMSATLLHKQVLPAIIHLVAVPVMHQFSRLQRTAKHLFGHESVFVHIAIDVRLGVIGLAYQNIAIGCDRASALPVRILCSGELSLPQSHIDSVAHRNQIRKG